MTGLKLLTCFGMSICLFAESPAPDPFGGWGQLGALGIVAVVLVFIVTRMLPSIHDQFVAQSKAFAEAMVRSQADFSAVIAKLGERQDLNTKALVDLREHCAAVRARIEGRNE